MKLPVRTARERENAAVGSARTIVDVLLRRAAEQASETVFAFISDGQTDAAALTFAQLDARARAIASRLLVDGLSGEPALLLYPAGLEFIEAFFGCLYAGVVAVPAPPPRGERSLDRLAAIAANAEARAALAPANLLRRFREARASHAALAGLRWMATDEVPADAATGFVPQALQAESLAYLQYTSGSTCEPKGVMVGHANLVANCEDIRRGFGHTRKSRSLSWLPHFHDMGLVDGVVQPVYSGFPAVLMSPGSFLQSPSRWLETISRHRITHSGGPNFAYDLCVRRIDPDNAKLDLRSWAVAYNGAEPVRAETLERFASRFAPCGFRRSAFYPAYGLAEATLKVSGGRRGEGPRILHLNRAALQAGRAADDDTGQALVGSGRPGAGTRAAIVDPLSGHRRAENEVGEIWVSGPSVALGYWSRSDETARSFGARIPGNRSRFLRTGDLGFLRDGEVFVTGRLKDLLIIRGRNLYPQDIERTAQECHAALRAGAAFGVEVAGEERLVLVQEVDRHRGSDSPEIFAALRTAIVETYEVDPFAVVLVGPAGVPKTSSGKVRRAACRAMFLADALPVVARWQAPEAPDTPDSDRAPADVRAWMAARLTSKLGVPPGSLRFDQPLAALGFDSLRSLELAHEIQQRFGATLPAADLLAAASLSEIAARVEAESASACGAPGGVCSEPEECPLSAGQQAIWFLQELAPDSTAYTMASALRLTGPLREAALEGAVRALIARHASLRARIVSEGVGPRQRFDVGFEAIYSRENLDDRAPGSLADRLAEQAYQPFPLAEGPLFRLALLRTADSHILLVSAHHAIADLWSLSVVLRDLQALYAAQLGLPGGCEAAAPHPSEFVRWQEQLVGSGAGESQFKFWLGQIAGEIPALDLPADRARPPAQTFAGAARTLRLDPALAGSLRDLARSRGITLYTLLLAAYQAFLGRITGQTLVQVGSPASGRTLPRFSGLVAYLVNTVVLRADLSEDPPFLELARATRDRVLGTLRNQDYPFATLVRRLAPKRDPSRSPFFDTLFDFQGTGDLVRGDLAAGNGGARLEFALGVAAEPLPVARRGAQFDFSTTAIDEGNGISLEFEYNSDLFDATTVDHLAQRFVTLLGGVAADPSARVSQLPLLSRDERAAALGESNAQPACREVQPVHRLFERQAARRPAAAAVHHGEACLSYGELNRRAGALARCLRAVGVGPESRVAVCIEKSADLIVALLGVLKAGGAYVPIDPSLPAARRHFMAADSGAVVLLARAGLARGFPPQLLRLDREEWPDPAVEGAADGENLAVSPAPGNLAYLIYTSGTSGTPKSVGVTQANLHGAFRAWEKSYDLPSLATHLQMANPGFDVFTGDLVRALCSGGTLVLCDRDTLLDPPSLAALARTHRVEFAEFVPATLRELAGHLWRVGERLDSLRLVAVGSDTWSMADYALFRRAFGPATRLVNSYGVTEATIDSTLDEVTEGERQRAAPAIGRPLANTSAYVLDGNLEPLPAGIRGELYLGGPAVARGYVARPDLTAERFVPDPHGGPGTRMYRTGDAARRRADGRLEFVGRTDAQVKIRGYRVEPAEVEAVLKTHPKVRACAVVAREHRTGPRLMACAVLDGELPEAAPGLRAYLADKLPDYMVPSAIVVLEALPLSANGKVDRRALPEPEWPQDSESAEGVPASVEERTLAGIWQGVLGLARVGRDENFFELGGDSILSIQVVARAREAGLRVTPRMLFEHPTVAGLAGASERAATVAPVIPAWSGEAPLLPMQHWFLDQTFSEPSHWNLTVALDTREPLDAQAVRRAVAALVEHHDALRARFEHDGTHWHQVIEPPGAPEADLLVLEASPGESFEAAVGRCAQRLNTSLDIERRPVVRFGIVADRSHASTTLVLAAHHLVVDGVSLRLLVEDFDRAYRQAQTGGGVGLPPRTLPAATWAAALAEAARAGRFDGDLDHWRGLADTPPAVFPLDRTASGPREETTAAATLELDERETGDLLRVSGSAGERVENVFLAALASSSALRTGAGSFYVELEGHGRDGLGELDVSRTVGWFTETHPVLIGGVDPADFSATLKAVARATQAAAGNGFHALLRHSPDPQVRDTLRRIAVPSVSFNYLGRFDAALQAGSLFERLLEPSSVQRSPKARRTHALEIDASVVGGRLRVRWSYSRAQFEASTIEQLAAGFREALAAFAAPRPTRHPVVEDRLALTPMQEGMLFHHLREGSADPYVAQIALELTGSVDRSALARAWQLAVDTHPALRAEFVWEGVEHPVQIIRRDVALPVTVHERAQVTLDEVMAGARAGGFDVSRAPLARVDLLGNGPGQTTAVFTHHHLLLDGWSLPVLLGTVFEAYDSLTSGGMAPRPEAATLRRYAAWLAARDPGDATRFFRKYLENFASPTAAPNPDPPSDADSARTSATCGVLYARGPCDAARRARALGLTMSTVVQAAWAMVLAASSGERDVLFGATSSGRPPEIEGIESLVGLCINTLPLRLKVDGRARAREWMLALQRLGAELRQYEYAPLALIQRCAAIPPNTPLFESLLVFENYPVDIAALGRRARFAVTSVRLHEETHYPLTLVVSHEDGLRFRALYRRPHFNEGGVRLVLQRLVTTLEELLTRPAARLGEISVLPGSERERVLCDWNDTRRDYPRGSTIAEVFEGVARERQNEVALAFEGGEVTYGELRDRAELCAGALRARGVGPESRVALAMDRSPELIVAILGILRAGGAYVPLDAESPGTRTARLLADAGTSLLVTDGRPAAWGGAFPLVSFEELGAAAGAAAPLPAPGAGPEGLAYVMFTSGSTGEPKGTEVTNRNVLRLVLGSEFAQLGPGQTLLQLAPVAFDASTFEIYGALLRGGRLAIAPPGSASAADVARLLRRFAVTVVWLTAGLFHLIVDAEPDALAQVEQVLAGGDVLSPTHVRRLLAAGCGRVVNGYGPTETTTFACCHGLMPGEPVGDRVPIGRPIANTRVYVLDEAMRPVPVGAPGDLHVGGDGVARGYARRPGLTADRFVPDPFGPPGSRLYRTGDTVRWRADGRIEFLGRRDGQVKVRGFRVESGEIEAALVASPGIRAAAVVARADGGSTELVAYLVTDENRDTEGVRGALASRLPRYMIPSRFVRLDALPLTPQGKVDRRALQAAVPRRAPGGRATRPMTPVEDAVAQLWRRVLGTEEVGPDDDFFELGGHSLHATRLLAALRRAFRIELPLGELYESTTVAGLARALLAHQPEPGHVERAARALARLRAMTGAQPPGAFESSRSEVKTP